MLLPPMVFEQTFLHYCYKVVAVVVVVVAVVVGLAE